MKNSKSVIALIMAVAMAISTVCPALAAETTSAPDSGDSVSVEAEVEEGTLENNEGISDIVENDQVESTDTEETDSSADGSDSLEEDDSLKTSEEPSQSEEQEEEIETEDHYMPSGELVSNDIEDLSVLIKYPEDTFELGTEMTASYITKEQELESAKEFFGKNADLSEKEINSESDMPRLLHFEYYTMEGEIFSPSDVKPVDITLSFPEAYLTSDTTLLLAAVSEEGEYEIIDEFDINLDAGAVEFTTELLCDVAFFVYEEQENLEETGSDEESAASTGSTETIDEDTVSKEAAALTDSNTEGNLISRSKWIHEIVSLLSEQSSNDYSDNYFADYSSADLYYSDVMQAVAAGVIDISEGESFEPELPATRDFAAHTLNSYLGFVLGENDQYTFKDETLTHPTDAQVAINRGWFELDNGCFHEDRGVTNQEAESILQDVNEVAAAPEVDAEYQSEYTFEDDVIVIPQNIIVEINDENNQVILYGCDIEIHEGDIFVVFIEGLPIAYKAVSIEKDGNKTIVSVEKADASVFSYIDDQGILEITEEQAVFVPAQTSGPEVSIGDVHFQDGKVSIEMTALDGMKSEVYLSDMRLEHAYTNDGYSLVLKGNWGYKGNMKLSSNIDMPLGEIRVLGVGAIKISLSLSQSMTMTADVSGTFSTGVAVNSTGEKRVIKEFNTSDPSVEGQGEIDLSIKVSGGVDVLVVSADLYAEISMATQYTSKSNYDANNDKTVHCQDFKYYLYTEVGVSAEYYAFWSGKKESLYNDQVELPDNIAKPFIFQIHFEDGVRVANCTFGMTVPDLDYGGISSSFTSTLGSDNRARIMETNVTLPSDLVVSEDYTVANGTLDLNGHVLTIEGNLIQTGGVIFIHGGRLIVKGDYSIQGPDWKPSEGYLRMEGSSDQLDIDGDFIIQSNQKSAPSYGIIRLKGNFSQYNTNKTTSNFQAGSGLTFSMCGGDGQTIHFDSASDNNTGYLKLMNSVISDSGITVSGASINGHSLMTQGNLKHTEGTFITGGGEVSVGGDLQLTAGKFTHNGGTVTVNGDAVIATMQSDGSYGTSNCYFYMEGDEPVLTIEGDLVTNLSNANLGCSSGTMRLKGDWINVKNGSGNLGCSGSGTFSVILEGSGTQSILNKNNSQISIPTLKIENAPARSIMMEGRIQAGTLEGGDLSITAKNVPELTFGTTKGAVDISGEVKLSVTEKAGGDITVDGNLTTSGMKLSGRKLTVPGNLKHTEGTFITGGGEVSVGGDLQLTAGKFTHNGGTVTVNGDAVIAAIQSDGSYGTSNCYFYMEGDEPVLTIEGDLVTNLSNANLGCSSGTMRLKGDWINVKNGSGNLGCSGSGTFSVILEGSGTQSILNKNNSQISIPTLKIENAPARSIMMEGRIQAGTLEGGDLSITAKNVPELTFGTTKGAVDISGEVKLSVTEKAGGDITVDGNLTTSGMKLSGRKLTVPGNLKHTEGTFITGGGEVSVGGDLQLTAGKFTHNGGTVTVNGDAVIAAIQSDGSYGTSNCYFYMEGDEPVLTIEGDLVTNLSNANLGCSSGTMRLKGDWINVKNGSGNLGCSGSGTFSVILEGSGTQSILNKNNSQISIPTLKIENAPARSIMMEGRIQAGTLEGGDLSITAKNVPELTFGTTKGAVDISGEVKLSVTEKAGGDITVDGNLTTSGMKLSGRKLTVPGNLKHTEGTFITGGGEVSVGGDLQLTAGKFTHNGGTVTVNGDAVIAAIQSDGSYGTSNCYFYMEGDEPVLTIEGDLVTNLSNANLGCSSGTMRLKGDWINVKNGSGNLGCSGSGTFSVILEGSGTQSILNKNNSQISIPTLKIENAPARSIMMEGRIQAGTLEGGDLSITAKNVPELTFGTTKGAVDISGEVKLSVTEKAGGDITVDGNLTTSGMKLSGRKLTVPGNLKHTEGTFITGGGEVSVGGDLQLTAGKFTHNGGTVTVNGDAVIAAIQSDGSYGTSNCYFYMEGDEPVLTIEGDLVTNLSNANLGCSSGTMRLKGDWINVKNGSGNLGCSGSGTFSVILEGSGTQSILNKNNSQISIPTLNIENAPARNIMMEGRIQAGTLEGGDLSITAKNVPELTFGTTKGAVDISGEVKLSVTEKAGGDITVDGNLISNDLRLAGYKMTVNGDFELLNGNSVKIGINGILTVNGELYQTNGTMNLDGGTLQVHGDYTVASRSESGVLSSCSGRLYMTNASDLLVLDGDYTVFSSNSSSLSAGTMKIAGDFTQLSSNGYDFSPSGTHEVILNGNQKQIVKFTSSNAKFNRLYLEQDISQYEFSPDQCWRILEDDPYSSIINKPVIYRIVLTPNEAELMPGEELQFSARVIGFNNPSQAVEWTLSGNTSENTTLSDDGLLTIAEDENGEQLLITAKSLDDEEKTSTALVNIYHSDNTPSIRRVIVSPNSATIAQGDSETFIATVTGTNHPSQSVVWSLSGNSDQGTFISNTGVLMIGENEPAGTLTVSAVSSVDPSKMMEVPVKVVELPTIHVSYKGAALYVGDDLPELSLESGDTEGIVTLDEDQVLVLGTKMYSWTFVPEDTDTYAVATGSIELVVEEREPVAVDINECNIVLGSDSMVFTGNELTPVPVITLGEKTLAINKDYTLAYEDNINAGTAKIIIKGIGVYTGAVEKEFTIKKAVQSITAKAAAGSIPVGKTTTLSAIGAVGQTTWTSANTALATVSGSTVKGVKVGIAKFTVTAAETENYEAATAEVTVKILPAATTKLTAANHIKGIKLVWTKVAGANGYIIYRNNKKIKTINSGSTVTFADTAANTNGTKYVYKVVAKASTGISTLSKSLTTYRVARPAITSLSNSASKKITVKWGKNAKASGYQIQYSLKSNFSGAKSVTAAKAATVSKVIGGLTKGKTYYVRIRTYKTVGKTKYYSLWSTTKKVIIKK